ncbi:MAG: hypothetical protein ABIU07_13905, partial [Ramlibacter sp.]
AAMAFATTGQAAPKPENAQECKAIEKQVEQLEAEGRKAMSPQQQDQLRSRTKTVRDRQFEIKC